MRKISMFIILFLVFLLGLYSAPKNNFKEILIDWDKESNKIKIPRINSDTAVGIKVVNFNFFHYSLQFDINEETVEAYKAIEKLWEETLRLPTLISNLKESNKSYSDKEGKSFEDMLLGWANKLEQADNKVEELLIKINNKITNKNKTSIIVQDHEKELKKFKTDVSSMKEDIEEYSLDVKSKLKFEKPSDYFFYEEIKKKHIQVVDKLNSFLNAADLTINGYYKNIGKKKSGTIITITITPKDRYQAPQKKIETLSYFVHSRLPLTFHIGYVYSNLKDIEFEKVYSLESTDLFTKVKDKQGTEDFVAFLSFELLKREKKEVNLYLTLGTNLSSPGEKWYVGGSLKLFSRFFLTGGVASAIIAETDDNNKIVEKIIEEAKVRNLYTTFTKTRDWEWFIGISFSFF